MTAIMHHSDRNNVRTDSSNSGENKNVSANNHKNKPEARRTILLFTLPMAIGVICSMLAAFSAGGIARLYLTRRRTQGRVVGPNTQLPEDQEGVERHTMFCQQVLIDWDHMQRDLLQSQQLLSNALIEAVSVMQETKLSYHCHEKTGVTCVATFQGHGHVALHTRPADSVLMMDILRCGDDEEEVLLDLLEHVAETFSPYSEEEQYRDDDTPFHAAPNVRWGIKLRRSFLDEGSDMRDELGYMAASLKHARMHVETDFQDITVLERVGLRELIIGHFLEATATSADSYQSRHPELFQPDKFVYLSGAMQSNRYGDAAYHESLVHPAMFTHEGPKRVAIIGGGEGATLREVLKHRTVEQAIMVEIDEQMMSASREHLPEWSDCSNMVNSTESCFDDPRAHVYAEDALAWFIDRFHGNETTMANEKGLDNAVPMDIIIMDALDPQDQSEFCHILYNHDTFFHALYSALTESGFLVVQLGEAPERLDPPDFLTMHSKRAYLTDELESVGFSSLHVYDEKSHSGFDGTWTYLVAFKNYESRVRWYANQAEIELRMHGRAMETRNGEAPFAYFDSATMTSFQIPHKVFEEAFCKGDPQPESCRTYAGFKPTIPNVPVCNLEVKISGQGGRAGRGIFTKVDIPENSYVAIDTAVDQVFFPPSTYSLITDLGEHKEGDALNILDYYMHGYGFEGDLLGNVEVNVDSGATTFSNHGCNGTYNIGSKWDLQLTENTVSPHLYPAEMEGDVQETLYDPCLDRQIGRINSSGDKSLRDIYAGEELLSNYLGMQADPKDWSQYVFELRAQCNGDGIGEVSEYEELDVD